MRAEEGDGPSARAIAPEPTTVSLGACPLWLAVPHPPRSLAVLSGRLHCRFQPRSVEAVGGESDGSSSGSGGRIARTKTGAVAAFRGAAAVAAVSRASSRVVVVRGRGGPCGTSAAATQRNCSTVRAEMQAHTSADTGRARKAGMQTNNGREIWTPAQDPATTRAAHTAQSKQRGNAWNGHGQRI